MPAGPSDAIDLNSLSRALVVKLRHHGDVLLASPVLGALKRAAPRVEIDALVYAETAPMLEGHPALSGLFVIDREWRALPAPARAGREIALWRRLRARRHELLLHLTESPRGAWLARTLGCRYAVAPALRVRSAWWRASFTHLFVQPGNARRHMVEWNLDALRRIGVQPAPEDRNPVLAPGGAAEAEADRLLAQSGLARGRFIHLHPASRWAFKCWPAQRNAALVDALLARGEPVALTSGPDRAEREFTADIVARCAARPVDFSGRLSLKSLAALSARAKLFIGVDSAPMHIAAAMGTPVVALFGPSGEAQWGPWSARARVVASTAHACRPCGIDGCGGGKQSDCLAQLPEARVLVALDALLAA
ncbi:MAG: putative lipopolysaccharide heptosyltransferase III [Burkholderiales bacterium]|nr:putative lipopolysaccharide heptosyltransferase III [Burkholderiales bacterium]